MLIDIIGQNNTVTFNSYIASKIGLNQAIYLSELLREYAEAQSEKRVIDSYFTLDRAKIYSRTTFDEAVQQGMDVLFVKLNILLKRTSQIDPLNEEISINMNNLINVFATDDEKAVKDLNKLTKSKTAVRLSERQKYKVDLKNNLRCSNSELLQAYRDWIEGVYANPNGFLSPKAIQLFQETVDNFAQNDLDLALKIVEIATIHGYRDAQWAINMFKKDYEKQFNLEHGIKSNKPARVVQLSNEVF